MKVTIESAGRISLDDEAQRRLGLEPGDHLVLEKDKNGWTLRPTDPQDSPSPPGPNGSHSEELASRFKKLAKAWKKETAHLSSTARMAKHPAYQEIIKMGSAAIPVLLDALREEPDFWFAALREITGENPVPESSAGKIDEVSQAWLEWGKTRGLIK